VNQERGAGLAGTTLASVRAQIHQHDTASAVRSRYTSTGDYRGRFLGYDPGGNTASWRTAFKGEVTMRRVGFLMIVLALAGGCDDDNPGSPTSGPIIFTAQLSPANEVPAIQGAEASGRGFAIITFDVPRDGSGNVTGAGTATFEIQTGGFPDGTVARLAHIHPGAAGVNGGVLVSTGLTAADPINMGAGSVSRTLTAPVTQVDATNIVANPGAYYFNVHTANNPGGVMRGQLIRQ
jgi:CHRD domain-containing protein